MKKVLTALSGIGLFILGLLGILRFLSNKETTKVLNDNDNLKKELDELNKEIQSKKIMLDDESKMRNQLKDDIERAKNEEVSSGDVLDFFNKRK